METNFKIQKKRIIDFIEDMNWQFSENNDNYIVYLPPQIFKNPQQLKLLVPKDETKANYALAIDHLLDMISQVHAIPKIVLLNLLKSYPKTKIVSRRSSLKLS